MANRIINNVHDRLEEGLRILLGRLTPDGRIIFIITMFVFFSGLSIYMSVSSIYNFGKKSGIQLEIERIETLRLQSEQASKDSINQLNSFYNGTGEFE